MKSDSTRRRRIVVAHAGIRGIPANYGGSEQAVEALIAPFAARGIETVVYCRSGHYEVRQSQWCGANLVYLPAPRLLHFETLVHSFLATLHAGLVTRPAILHFHGRGNALFLPLAKLLHVPAVLWVDGLEWERAKWGPLAKAFHKHVADRLAVLFSRGLLADAPTIAAYYRRRFGRGVPWVAFGAVDVSAERDPGVLGTWDLQPGRYCLFVGRLTPEKDVDTLIRAYADVKTNWPLIIVGDNPYDPDYITVLRRRADPRVRFVGAQFGASYRALLADAAVSIHPSRVEGTSPALLTALASGRAVIASNIAENIQAAGDAAAYFPVGDAAALASVMQRVIDDEPYRRALGERAAAWARDRYLWDAVAEQLISFYTRVNPQIGRTLGGS